MTYRIPEANRIEFKFPLPPWKIRIDRMLELANHGLNAERRQSLRVRPLVLGKVDDGWPEIESLEEADSELRQLRRWLDRLVRYEKATPKLKNLIHEDVTGLHFHGLLADLDKHDLAAHAVVGGITFANLSRWYSMCLLVMVQHGLDGRVRKCELESCGRYFVDWPKKRGKPKARYCTSNCGAVIHNRKSRAKKKAARERQRRSQMI